MKNFLPDLEKLPNFLRCLKDDSMIFGDFNVIRIVESKEMKDYEKRPTAFVYRKQNILSTRVTPTSATCLDHVITSFSVSIETGNTSFSDHYTVLDDITINFQKNIGKNHPARIIREEKVLNILVLLDQNLKNIKNEGVLVLK